VFKQLTIAIDGPASSGKGTVARKVARSLGYAYIDTGAMFRGVALVAERRGLAWSDSAAVATLAESLTFEFTWKDGSLALEVDGTDVTHAIRNERIGRGASDVAVYPGVRLALLAVQRSLGRSGGIVMDGRDIGSIVLPQAELKIYLDASVSERARRRHEELSSMGVEVELSTIQREVSARDQQDRGRENAPLIQAHDAVYLDTTGLSPTQAAGQIIKLATERA
jgi:CMP/dCMP kinase